MVSYHDPGIAGAPVDMECGSRTAAPLYAFTLCSSAAVQLLHFTVIISHQPVTLTTPSETATDR
ncbi:MAG: hypothetical protein KatS3mg055_2499 [Chloroflexus sp.]|nr:MAG: hypothetical protein KatS3mg055_2499 [Chloroflexus sp.]